MSGYPDPEELGTIDGRRLRLTHPHLARQNAYPWVGDLLARSGGRGYLCEDIVGCPTNEDAWEAVALPWLERYARAAHIAATVAAIEITRDNRRVLTFDDPNGDEISLITRALKLIGPDYKVTT